MKAIIISGLPAAGKTTLAKMLGKKLKVPAISAGDILKEMAKERGYYVTGNEWWDTAEGMRFLKERNKNADFDKETDRRLIMRIKDGNIVVTSYTMPWLSRYGFKIWLVASLENRAKRMAERDNSSLKVAIAATKKRDRNNAKLYRELYKIDFGKDMEPFDMIVDTDGVSAGQVAKKILARIKELKL